MFDKMTMAMTMTKFDGNFGKLEYLYRRIISVNTHRVVYEENTSTLEKNIRRT